MKAALETMRRGSRGGGEHKDNAGKGEEEKHCSRLAGQARTSVSKQMRVKMKVKGQGRIEFV